MNFFQQVHALGLQGDLKIVTKSVGDKMIVSVLLTNDRNGDNAAKAIVPLLFNSTPEAIDNAFFADISEPMKSLSGIMVNMEAHLKSVENASKQAAMNKKAEAKPADSAKKTEAPKAVEPPKPVEPPVDPKQVAYDNAMKKVEELTLAKKYKEAIAKLPAEAEYPEQAAVIKAKRNEIVARYQGISIFDQSPV